MGLFDTIILPEPIKCDKCGEAIKDIQTKQFGSMLEHYAVGDCIFSEPVTGIIREELYCYKCHKPLDTPNLYILIKRHIYIGVATDRKLAEQKLKEFGDWEIYDEYFKLYKKKYHLQRKYTYLTNLLRDYQEYINMSCQEKENYKENKALWTLHFSFIEEFLDKKDAIERIIKKVEEPDGKEKEDNDQWYP